MNEGFATYMSYVGSDHVQPENKILERYVYNEVYATMRFDSYESSHPISVQVNHPYEIQQIFDDISYGKASCVIRMMVHFLGEETFMRGVSSYLKKFSYSNANQNDLWNSLSEASRDPEGAVVILGLMKEQTTKAGLNVAEIMNTWTLQKGFPYVTIERAYEGVPGTRDLIRATQNRFLQDMPEAREAADVSYRWWIPISYAKAGGNFSETEPKFWLSPEDEYTDHHLAIKLRVGEALIVNVQETGFYRVNYDDRNWGLLEKTLKSDRNLINPVNRGQIINDAMNLAKVGILRYDVALPTTLYLDSEDSFAPWATAIDEFDYLNLMMQRSSSYIYYKLYITSKMNKVYERLGFSRFSVGDNPREEPFNDHLLRYRIVRGLSVLEYKPVKEQAMELFGRWMAQMDPDTYNPIDAELRYSVYCTAVTAGNLLEWDFLWHRYKKSNNGNERYSILRALGCSRMTWLLQVS